MSIQKGLIIQSYVPSASVVTDIQAIQAVNDDWYGIACTDRKAAATLQVIAAYIETQIKLFGTSSNDANIINEASGIDTTSMLHYSTMQVIQDHSYYITKKPRKTSPRLLGSERVASVPGSETWAFKQLGGDITYSDLSTTQESNAFAKQCNTYEYIGGVGITQRGTVAVGEYIDIIRGIDWLTTTMQTYVYSILVNSPKIPYTD